MTQSHGEQGEKKGRAGNRNNSGSYVTFRNYFYFRFVCGLALFLLEQTKTKLVATACSVCVQNILSFEENNALKVQIFF